MKITYAIAGFVAGILLGLLAGIAAMKLLKRLQYHTAIPFVIGLLVISFAITGIVTGVKIANRK